MPEYVFFYEEVRRIACAFVSMSAFHYYSPDDYKSDMPHWFSIYWLIDKMRNAIIVHAGFITRQKR